MPSKPAAVFLDFSTLGPEIDTACLDDVADIRYFDVTEPEHVSERIRDCEVVLLNKTRVDADALAQAGRLRLIAITATGCDNVDLQAARTADIAVANVRDYCSHAVAQHVFALILGLTQHVGLYDGLVRSGAWSRSRSFALFDYPIRELAGRKLGIIGYGTLGQAVARVGESFGMDILVSQRPGTDGPPGEGRVAVAQVLAESDVLSLHCPLNDATRHLLNADAFERMQRDAVLINTARGGLVDRRALADALREGRIGGAGIDVLPEEPPPADDPLFASGIPNLIITPHIAWAARESRQRALCQVAENVAAFLAGDSLRRIV